MDRINDRPLTKKEVDTYNTLAIILGISYQEVLKLSPKVEETKCHSGNTRTGYRIIISSDSSELIMEKLNFRSSKGQMGHEILMPNPYLFE